MLTQGQVHTSRDLTMQFVTLENSIIKGHHFYSTVALSKTVSGWVRTQIFRDIGGLPIAHLQRVLLRIMIYFGKSVKEGTNSTSNSGNSLKHNRPFSRC